MGLVVVRARITLKLYNAGLVMTQTPSYYKDLRANKFTAITTATGSRKDNFR